MYLKFWGVEINMPPLVAILVAFFAFGAISAVAAALFGVK